MDSEQYIAIYEPLVKKIAGKYYRRNLNNGICLDDLLQEGRMAVWKACGYPAFQNLSGIDADKYIMRAISIEIRNYIINELSPCSKATLDRSKESYSWVNKPVLYLVGESAVTDENAHDELNVKEFIDHVTRTDSSCGEVLSLLYGGESWDGVSGKLRMSKRDVRDRVLAIRSMYAEYTLREETQAA